MIKLISYLFVCLIAIVSCGPEKTSNDIQRERQEKNIKEGISQVGIPSIKNFRELKIAKDIYELRDQTGLITYSYLWSDLQGKMIFLCESVGYPIPYSTQFTSPEVVQRWFVDASGGDTRHWGTEKLPQAEPNGLFSPSSSEGTWIMCKNPNGKDTKPVYTEPRVIVSQFKLGD